MRTWLIILLVGLAAWGTIMFNGAGLSHSDDLMAAQRDNPRVRPLLSASYWLNRQIGLWMPTNLVIHLLGALLVGLLALRVSDDRQIALVAGSLFAAHPMAGDAVASLAGRSSMLCGVLILAFILALTRGVWGVAVILGGMALLVKEEAAAVLLLSPAVLWILDRRREAAVAAACAIVMTVCLAPATLRLARDVGRNTELVAAGMPATLSFTQYVPQYVAAATSYVLPRLVVPARLSGDPDPDVRSTWAWIGAALYLLALAMIILEGFSPVTRLGIALIALSPVALYALIPLPDLIFEHRAYLALAGAAILLARITRGSPAIASGLIAAFMIGTSGRAAVYSSPAVLYADAAEKAPGKARIHNNLAIALAQNGDLAGAVYHTRLAITLNPMLSASKANLVTMYLMRHDIASASRVLDREPGFRWPAYTTAEIKVEKIQKP